MGSFDYIRDNLFHVRDTVRQRAESLGVKEPLLVAVTKSADNDEVRALVSLGVSDIAENRTSLFNERYDLFDDDTRPRMHLIGSLQTNKAKTVIGKTALVQSVDRESLVTELDRLSRKNGLVTRVLLEVNSGREENKGGAMPEDAERIAEVIAACEGLSLAGVMTMGCVTTDTGLLRACFRTAAGICRTLDEKGYFDAPPILSMGMSDSYEVAIEEGATMIRVGRTLFAK